MEEQDVLRLRIHSVEADISRTMNFKRGLSTLQCVLNIISNFRIVGVEVKPGASLFRPHNQTMPPPSTSTGEGEGIWLDKNKSIGSFDLQNGDLLFLAHRAGTVQSSTRAPAAQKKNTFWENEDAKVKFLVSGRKLRNEAAVEIVSTERTYYANLTLMLEVFVRPLRQHQTYLKLASAEKFNLMFSLLETIHTFHGHFLEQLEDRTQGPNSSKMDALGDVIIQLSPFLKIYGEYCMHYDRFNSDFRNIILTDATLGPFIAECEASPRLNQQKWPDYFIQPVQRIPRYRLLIENLLKHTPKEHSDYETLSNAQDKVVEVAAMVNSYKDKTSKMLDLAEQILDLPFPLLTGNRFLLLEGDLKKNPVSSNAGALTRKKNRHFFLFNDLLLYCETSSKKTSYRYKGVLHLHPEEYSVVQKSDTSFLIKGKKRELEAFTTSKEETLKWVEAINTILQPTEDRKGTIALKQKVEDEEKEKGGFLRHRFTVRGAKYKSAPRDPRKPSACGALIDKASSLDQGSKPKSKEN